MSATSTVLYQCLRSSLSFSFSHHSRVTGITPCFQDPNLEPWNGQVKIVRGVVTQVCDKRKWLSYQHGHPACTPPFPGGQPTSQGLGYCPTYQFDIRDVRDDGNREAMQIMPKRKRHLASLMYECTAKPLPKRKFQGLKWLVNLLLSSSFTIPMHRTPNNRAKVERHDTQRRHEPL